MQYLISASSVLLHYFDTIILNKHDMWLVLYWSKWQKVESNVHILTKEVFVHDCEDVLTWSFGPFIYLTAQSGFDTGLQYLPYII